MGRGGGLPGPRRGLVLICRLKVWFCRLRPGGFLFVVSRFGSVVPGFVFVVSGFGFVVSGFGFVVSGFGSVVDCCFVLVLVSMLLCSNVTALSVHFLWS